ncbi:MAG: peroxiredoxin [Pseudomonadota bacterium]
MIKKGEAIPSAKVYMLGDNGPVTIDAAEFLGQSHVVLFGVPGAFTPTCSLQHAPGFIADAALLKQKGIDKIVCMSVNDAFVMDAWGRQLGSADQVVMLSDGNGLLTKVLGLELDLTKVGLGQRCKRFAMIIKDGIVERLDVEEGVEFKVSSSQAVLSAL